MGVRVGLCPLAADRVAAFVVMFVSADDQIDAVVVEQGHPLLPDTEVGAVELVGGADDDLMHAHDDPVDVRCRYGFGVVRVSSHAF